MISFFFEEVTFASNALFLNSTSPEKASGIETAKDEITNDENEELLRDFKKKGRSRNGNDKYEEKRKGLV